MCLSFRQAVDFTTPCGIQLGDQNGLCLWGTSALIRILRDQRVRATHAITAQHAIWKFARFVICFLPFRWKPV